MSLVPMLKVTYFYREPRKTGLSIEGIFHAVRSCLKENVEITEVYCDPSISRIKNVIRAREHSGKINHITGDVNFLALGLAGKKNILTIHDLGHHDTLKKRSYINYIVYKVFWFMLPLRYITIVTVISEFTKGKLIKYFNVPEEKIRVIYDPVKPMFQFRKKAGINSTPRILQIGSGKHKNLNNLIEATKGLNVHLDIIAWVDDETVEKLKRYNIPHSIYNGLSEEELFQKYADADILYFASFYEGFGMPIIEAQAVGRPVITSNYGAMKEVAGTSAYLVDPNNCAEIKKAITTLIGDWRLYEELVARGLENITKFECGKIADDYLAVYRELDKMLKNLIK